jgi:hypothetical protein
MRRYLHIMHSSLLHKLLFYYHRDNAPKRVLNLFHWIPPTMHAVI